MTAYTEARTSTTTVTRTFDRANQLATSYDRTITTTYTYDGNGNLTTITTDPMQPAGQGYTYDQRNLLTAASQTHGSTSLVAEYAYDGDSNRLQQVDYTGSKTITTTYTNDILGLSQVLVATQGANQVHNLFGLDLIHQDTSTQTLTLLTDGLGSIRLEMAATLIKATTYDPYGNPLTTSGTSGTSYGFTGEQEDNSTSLLYLRARYYSPSLNQFQSRDPFAGYPRRPASYHGYSYVYASPVNLTDPNGRDPWWCDESAGEYGKDSCYSIYSLRRPDVTLSEAREIFADMANERDIPFAFPADGCYGRAHFMIERIAERYDIDLHLIQKVSIHGNLVIKTEYNYQALGLGWNDETVGWGWHVAPLLDVEMEDGRIVPMVIDPSLFDEPVPIRTWAAKMNNPDAMIAVRYRQWFRPADPFLDDETATQITEQDLNYYLGECQKARYCSSLGYASGKVGYWPKTP